MRYKTGQELHDTLTEFLSNKYDDYYFSCPSEMEYGLDKLKLEDVKMDCIYSCGGESEGEYLCYIYNVEFENEKYTLAYEGLYNSWDGEDWDRPVISLVEPREVTVTKYFTDENIEVGS